MPKEYSVYYDDCKNRIKYNYRFAGFEDVLNERLVDSIWSNCLDALLLVFENRTCVCLEAYTSGMMPAFSTCSVEEFDAIVFDFDIDMLIDVGLVDEDSYNVVIKEIEDMEREEANQEAPF